MCLCFIKPNTNKTTHTKIKKEEKENKLKLLKEITDELNSVGKPPPKKKFKKSTLQQIKSDKSDIICDKVTNDLLQNNNENNNNDRSLDDWLVCFCLSFSECVIFCV